MQTVSFAFNNSGTLPTLPKPRIRVDSVMASPAASATSSDVESDSDVSSEPAILKSKITQGKSFKIDEIQHVLKSETVKHEDGKVETHEGWFSFKGEYKGVEDEDLEIKQKQKPAKKLVDFPNEKMIITFSPPSSPITEKALHESYFDHGPSSDIEQAPVPTPVQSMVTYILDLLAARASDKDHIRAAEDALISYLHTTAVDISDVEAILPPASWNSRKQRLLSPSLTLNPRIVGKLAVNIGLNTSRGIISADELEAIKLHILLNGDEKNGLFNRVNEQLERFKADSEAYISSKLTEKQKKQRAHQKRLMRQQEEKSKRLKIAKEEKSMRLFLAAVPKEWHAPWKYSPYESLVENLLMDHGIAWDRVPKKVRPAQAWTDPLGEGSFALTRLHNGPGLQDRGREAYVRIPKMQRKLPRRKPVNHDMGGLLSAQVQSMAQSDTGPLTTEAHEPIVVRLPPH